MTIARRSSDKFWNVKYAVIMIVQDDSKVAYYVQKLVDGKSVGYIKAKDREHAMWIYDHRLK